MRTFAMQKRVRVVLLYTQTVYRQRLLMLRFYYTFVLYNSHFAIHPAALVRLKVARRFGIKPFTMRFTWMGTQNLSAKWMRILKCGFVLDRSGFQNIYIEYFGDSYKFSHLNFINNRAKKSLHGSTKIRALFVSGVKN